MYICFFVINIATWDVFNVFSLLSVLNFACTDVLENYYKQLENLQSDAFIVPAVHESFADSQLGCPTFHRSLR